MVIPSNAKHVTSIGWLLYTGIHKFIPGVSCKFLFSVLNFHITTHLKNVFLFKKKQSEIYLISTTNQQFKKILSIHNYDSIIVGAPAGSHGLPRNSIFQVIQLKSDPRKYINV